jgi:hypothetical protein
MEPLKIPVSPDGIFYFFLKDRQQALSSPAILAFTPPTTFEDKITNCDLYTTFTMIFVI